MIIGLGYKARSGKDLVADYLVREFGFNKTAFAETLKEACGAIFYLNKTQLYGSKKEVVDDFWKQTPRYILQRVGTECMRQGYDPDIWINSLKRRIMAAKKDTRWVVADVRFPNEANAIKEWGGTVIRIDRPQAGASGGISQHASEVSLEGFDAWDYVLENNGSVDDLFEKINKIMQDITMKSILR
jgi:hypothetical protein